MGADRVVLAMPPTADLDEACDLLSACAARLALTHDLNAFDRLALADLVHLYASAVDDRRFDDVIELFTETAELRLPDPPGRSNRCAVITAAAACGRRCPRWPP